MPSAWSWSTIPDLLGYASTLLAGADVYCHAHFGTGVLAVVPWIDGFRVHVLCGS